MGKEHYEPSLLTRNITYIPLCVTFENEDLRTGCRLNFLKYEVNEKRPKIG